MNHDVGVDLPLSLAVVERVFADCQDKPQVHAFAAHRSRRKKRTRWLRERRGLEKTHVVNSEEERVQLRNCG